MQADCYFFVTLFTGGVLPLVGCTYAECNQLLAVLGTAWEHGAPVAGYGVWYEKPHYRTDTGAVTYGLMLPMVGQPWFVTDDVQCQACHGIVEDWLDHGIRAFDCDRLWHCECRNPSNLGTPHD